jgi:hypothetical protein
MECHRARRFVRRAVQAPARRSEGRWVVRRPEVERVVRPVAVRPVVCPAQPEAARPDVPDGLHREHLAPARPSAAAARKVQAREEAEATAARRLAQAGRLAPAALQAAEGAVVQEAQQALGVAAAQPRAAPGVWGVAVVRQPAAEPAGAVRRLEVAAVQDVAAAVQRRAVGPASAAVRPRGAEVRDAGVLRPAARDAQGGLLLAAAWAALPSIRCRGGQPAPSIRAHSAHGRECFRTAQP